VRGPPWDGGAEPGGERGGEGDDGDDDEGDDDDDDARWERDEMSAAFAALTRRSAHACPLAAFFRREEKRFREWQEAGRADPAAALAAAGFTVEQLSPAPGYGFSLE